MTIATLKDTNKEVVGYCAFHCSRCGDEDVEQFLWVETTLSDGKKYEHLWCDDCVKKEGIKWAEAVQYLDWQN